ncbi:TIGR01621 family pseudouridine synthase [Cellvibrio japonicus]|nr:TIGR01621 family pseudouridine synthase [Cellvibrio japonicus]QEI12451.1 TIGR01621 family pseudouridine synthase [Cellvibrio japonicus]QEI16024.1 TIGR01621 family pseudouridine synthase [Cellvibrio japonicus]QEI19603.1 TIGR01621 family pseudouridine synthase [Cellvibrio japonicus]
MSDVFFQLVDEQEDFLLVYKKPGVSFHSEQGEPGLFEIIRQRGGYAQLYPVHRLDKVTSGLLVFAKTAEANHQLCAQFEQRLTQKYYLAISAGKPIKKQGLIKGDMYPARRGAWMLGRTLENPAITQFFSQGLGNGQRLYVLKPHTGKTHQLRVALKSIGAPIVGDSLYGDRHAGIDRVYLHAFSLAFTLNGVAYRYSELPREGNIFNEDSVKQAMCAYSNPWHLAWPVLSGVGGMADSV